MFQLFDIAYIIPASVILGFLLGQYLEKNYGSNLQMLCVCISVLLGFILTIFRINKFAQSQKKDYDHDRIDSREDIN